VSRVELHNVSRRFGTQAAVDGVTLVAEPGEFVALLGPSGCGKSTTLRLLAGLEPCDSGSIRIGGVDRTHAPPAQRGVAMVFQNYALFPHLSVADNIVFGLSVRRVPAAERQRRLARAAELLGLGPYLDRKPSQLSGGQRQRVALGRAIVAEAPVCLMDEPLSNLDAQLRQQMRAEIRELQQRLGITMLYVTHDQTEAMTMADKVVLMRAGKVEQQGSPQDLYTRPQTSFVAGFIGSPAMNLFPATLLQQGSSEMLVGVRPEDVSLAADAPKLHARVLAVEYLGAESLVICEAGEREPSRLVLRTGALAKPPQRGEVIGLTWHGHAEHWFSPLGGQRITSPPSPSP
jgi:sn-glycerol 3-phosphate transport system ATP-binding protein